MTKERLALRKKLAKELTKRPARKPLLSKMAADAVRHGPAGYSSQFWVALSTKRPV